MKLDQCHASCVQCDLQDALWGLMAAFTRTFDCCLAAIQVASLVDKTVLRIPSLHSIYIQGGGEGHMTMAPVGVTQFKVKAVQAVVCRHRWWLPVLLLARGREDRDTAEMFLVGGTFFLPAPFLLFDAFCAISWKRPS